MKPIVLFLNLIPIINSAQPIFVVGDETSLHTKINYNYIEAKRGNSNETLFLNFSGGGVRIGSDGGYIRYNSILDATGIGVLDPEARLHIAGNTDASLSTNGLLMVGNNSSTENIIIDANEIMARNNGSASTLYLNRDGGNVEFFGVGAGSFRVHGLPFGDFSNMQYSPSSGTFYYDNSSRRYKENIKTFKDDWRKILEVRPATYTRSGAPDRWEYGYVAEEIDSIGLTSMVGYDTEGNPEDVRYDKMIIYLVEMLKIQQQEINALKEQLPKRRRKKRSWD